MSSLSFEPKHHKQIAEGEDAGAWLAAPPVGVYGRTLETFFAESIIEREKIRAEGGRAIEVIYDKDPEGYLGLR